MKRSKSRINSSYGQSLNQCMDIERCQEELLRSRMKYNKLNQNYIELKVEYNKLEKDYKFNIKIIEAIVKESNMKALSEFLEDPKIDNVNENNIDNIEKLKENCLSKTTIKILKEKSIYENLKLEIMNLRDELKAKEKIIDDLKNSIKTTKYKELDNKFAQTYQELNAIKARNEVLESMQTDYVNSKNQIIFLLKQIDLYKKDNKKLKELYEKILFDFQNISKEKEEIENIKNFNDEKIKALVNKNQNMKTKLDDMKNRNIAYYEELEKYRNYNKGYIDKMVSKKEKEIAQYRNQITQLKLEIYSLQKKLEEKNKINLNTINAGFKKIKKVNKKDKDLRKTDSDFFITKPKGLFGIDKKLSNEKIVINSKPVNKTIESINPQKENKIFKIKISKDTENKNEFSDIVNNYDEKKKKKNIVIKDENQENDIKNTSNEKNLNSEPKKEESINKEEKNEEQDNQEQQEQQNQKEQSDQKEQIEQKDKNEEKEPVQQYDTSTKNNNLNILSKLLNEDSKNIESDNININSNNNNNDINAENIMDNEPNNNNEKNEKDKNISNQKEEEKENLENNDNEHESYKGRQKYNEEEIVAMNSNTNKDNKKDESSYGYNDFDSNIDKKNSIKDNDKNNITTNSEQDNNNIKNENTASVEQKFDSDENEKNQVKETNTKNYNPLEANLLSEEQKQIENEEEKNNDEYNNNENVNDENNIEENNINDNNEEYKFSSVNDELLSEENI